MEIQKIDVDGYEDVRHAVDESTGLEAYIAIHDTTLGPGAGGMRFWAYDSTEAALEDVLRLSRGMTYKSAIARTGLGGGKSVIVGDPRQLKSPELLQAMGRFIDSCEGRYLTAQDVNIDVSDLREVRKSTRWVTGLSREEGGSGNPSPYTGIGVELGIRTCLERVFGTEDPRGRRVAVQGVGAVALRVIADLHAAGAELIVCDIDEAKVDAVQATYAGVESVHPDAIYDVECDVFAPHALGAIINDETLPRIRARIIAGAANNQLGEVRHGDDLLARDILYAPDFVINAGGIVNVGCELVEGGYSEETSLAKIATIRTALRETFDESERLGIATNRAAIAVAERIVAEAREATKRAGNARA